MADETTQPEQTPAPADPAPAPAPAPEPAPAPAETPQEPAAVPADPSVQPVPADPSQQAPVAPAAPPAVVDTEPVKPTAPAPSASPPPGAPPGAPAVPPGVPTTFPAAPQSTQPFPTPLTEDDAPEDLSEQASGPAIPGQWVDVVKGPYAGVFGTYLQTLVYGEEGEPLEVLVRSRDHGDHGPNVDTIAVAYDAVVPSDRSGGR